MSVSPSKAHRFPVYQIDFSAVASGKHVAATKRRIRWRFGFPNEQALDAGRTGTECRGQESEIVVVWSITSGKRQILMDGKEVLYASSRTSVIDHSWSTKGNHILKVVCHAASPLSAQPGFRQYDLFIDGQSFFSMPKVFELGVRGIGDRVAPTTYGAPAVAAIEPYYGGDGSSYNRFGYGPPPSGPGGLPVPATREEEDADLQRAIKASLHESKAHLERGLSAGSGTFANKTDEVADSDLLDFSGPAPTPPPPPQFPIAAQPLYPTSSFDTSVASLPPSSVNPPLAYNTYPALTTDAYRAAATTPPHSSSQLQPPTAYGPAYGAPTPGSYLALPPSSSGSAPPPPPLQQTGSGSFYGSSPSVAAVSASVSAAAATAYPGGGAPTSSSFVSTTTYANDTAYHHHNGDHNDPFAPKPPPPPSHHDIANDIMSAYGGGGGGGGATSHGGGTPGYYAPLGPPPPATGYYNANALGADGAMIPGAAYNDGAFSLENGNGPMSSSSLTMHELVETDAKPSDPYEAALKKLVNVDRIDEPAEEVVKLSMKKKEEEMKKKTLGKSQPKPPVSSHKVSSHATLAQIQTIKPTEPKDPNSVMKAPPQLWHADASMAGALVVHGTHPPPLQQPGFVGSGFGAGYNPHAYQQQYQQQQQQQYQQQQQQQQQYQYQQQQQQYQYR